MSRYAIVSFFIDSDDDENDDGGSAGGAGSAGGGSGGAGGRDAVGAGHLTSNVKPRSSVSLPSNVSNASNRHSPALLNSSTATSSPASSLPSSSSSSSSFSSSSSSSIAATPTTAVSRKVGRTQPIGVVFVALDSTRSTVVGAAVHVLGHALPVAFNDALAPSFFQSYAYVEALGEAAIDGVLDGDARSMLGRVRAITRRQLVTDAATKWCNRVRERVNNRADIRRDPIEHVRMVIEQQRQTDVAAAAATHVTQ